MHNRRPELKLIKNEESKAEAAVSVLKKQYLTAKQAGDAETYYKVLKLYNALLLRENEI